MAGALLFIGCGALPQAVYFGTLMQQSIPLFTVIQMTEANKAPKELQNIRYVLMYRYPQGMATKGKFVSFSDSTFKESASQTYEQTGYVRGIQLRTKVGDATTHRVLDWDSVQQNRVSSHSQAAEIIACTGAADCVFNLKVMSQPISRVEKLAHRILVISKIYFIQ